MPQTCSICRHPERADIDAVLLAGEPFRHIAARTGTSTTALQRHRSHIPVALADAVTDARRVATVVAGDTLLDQVAQLRDEARDLMALARRDGDYRTAMQGITTALRCIDLFAELDNQLDRRASVNIIVTPEWQAVRGRLIAALEPFPEAGLAVSAALQAGEGTGGHGLG